MNGTGYRSYAVVKDVCFKLGVAGEIVIHIVSVMSYICIYKKLKKKS